MLRVSGRHTMPRQRCRVAGILTALAIALPTPAAQAQQFSAELTRQTADGNAAAGRIFVSDDKVRLETPEFPGSFFVIRRDRNAAYLVRPGRHEFMDARQSSPLTEIFVPVDPQAPCRQFQAMAEISQRLDGETSWQCRVTGEETIDGRKTIAYRLDASPDRQYAAWIDPRLGFVIRLAAADGTTFTLVHIKEGTQPDDLFEIPAGLRKFDPAHLIERIKRSDAWVEPTQ